MDVQGTLARLQADRDTGVLAALCDEFGVDLLVRFAPDAGSGDLPLGAKGKYTGGAYSHNAAHGWNSRYWPMHSTQATMLA